MRVHEVQDVRTVATVIEEAGGRLYLVGGGVRDRCMGNPAADLDYCVTGLSVETFQALFPNAFLAGESFPVFRMEVGNQTVEIAMARTEEKVTSGHKGFRVVTSPDVTIAQDLFRRDVTINAMAEDVLTSELLDPHGGREDIANGKIRAVSDAFTEDPLRVYRAARFAARFQFEITPDTLSMMNGLRGELDTLSVERVYIELKKALETPRPSIFFRALRAAGVLSVHFPELTALIGVQQPVKFHPEGDAFEHTMQVLDAAAVLTTRTEVRFSALVHDVGKGLTPPEKWPSHHGHEAAGVPLVAKLCQRLKLPTQWEKAACYATEHHMKIHFLDRLKPVKVVDLLTSANRNPIGVDGFAMVGLADIRGRNDPHAENVNAMSMEALWRCIQDVRAEILTTRAIGKAFGEALRRERAKAVSQWRQQHGRE